MNIRQVLGYLILLGLFLVMFVLTVLKVGFVGALISFGIAIAVIMLFSTAVFLIYT